MKFQILTQYSPWFVLLALLIAVLYAFLFYFRDKKFKDVPVRTVYFLAFLRFLTVFILILLLISPMIKTISTEIEQPIIVAGVDNSKSIALSLKDTAKYRKDLHSFLNSLQTKYILKVFSFDKNVYDTLNTDFSGNYTDISKFLQTVSDKFFNRNLGAVILFTDGIFNKGENPLYLANSLSFPVYCVAVGDTTSYKDLIIKDLIYNKIAFLGNNFPVIVNIQATKLKGEDFSIKIYNKGELLATKTIKITSGKFFGRYDFMLPAKYKGTQQYIIKVTHLNGEKIYSNNTKIFAVDVIDKRKKILILYNSPHPDIAAVKRALENEKTYKIDAFKYDKFTGNIADYNVVIFHQLPSAKYGISSVWAEVAKNKVPYVFIFGKQTDFKKFNALNAGLTINRRKNLFDDAQGFVNSEFTIFKFHSDLKTLLLKSPPLIVPYGSYKLSPEAQIVMYQRVKNIATSKPLIVLFPESSNTGTKSAIIFGENLWRWRMADYKFFKNQDAFDDLISQIIKYVALNLRKQRFIVNVKKVVPEKENIIFKAQFYNENLQPVNTPDLKLEISDSTNKIYSYTFNRVGNFYELDIGSFPVGTYKYKATLEFNGKKYFRQGGFTVIPVNVEAENLTADYHLLYNLSKRTGGKLLFYPNTDSLLSYLTENQNIKPVSYSTEKLTGIIKFRWLFFFILALLTLEWGLRKYLGAY